jgi:predicted acetyltransferase
VLGADAEVEAALWEHLLSVDLVTTIEAANRPVGDPVRWRLADPRRLQTEHVGDHLWVRLLDIGAALEARSYLVPDVLVLEVTDPFRPVNSGRWRLEAGPGGATCSRTEDAADVSLGVADLGAAYLGGVRPGTLARAGRVQERTPGALARLDLLLSWSVEPWCATAF